MVLLQPVWASALASSFYSAVNYFYLLLNALTSISSSISPLYSSIALSTFLSLCLFSSPVVLPSFSALEIFPVEIQLLMCISVCFWSPAFVSFCTLVLNVFLWPNKDTSHCCTVVLHFDSLYTPLHASFVLLWRPVRRDEQRKKIWLNWVHCINNTQCSMCGDWNGTWSNFMVMKMI